MQRLRQMMLFMNIVKYGSITNAADKLELSKSVLSQHLKKLESELSTTLLKRTTRRQLLTSDGKFFYDYCCKIHALAEQAWCEIFEQQNEPSGILSITAPHALMDTIVVPALRRVFIKHSKVALNLICQDAQLDLMANNIDLAIRVGKSPNSNYKQKRIGVLRDVLCKAKTSRFELKDASYIANYWQPTNIEHKFTDNHGQIYSIHFRAHHRTNTINQTIALIESGLGIGVVPHILLQSRKLLEPVAKNYHLANVDIYALHPYQTSVPIAVTMAQHAIEEQFKNMKCDN